MPPKKKLRERRTQPPADPAAAPSASRTPLLIQDPPPRWPLALWGLLSVLWALGSLISFTLVLASAGVMPQDVTDTTRREGAWALTWLLLFALVTPLTGAVTAALLRRRIAAILFLCALLLSTATLWALAPPAVLWEALVHGFSAPVERHP